MNPETGLRLFYEWGPSLNLAKALVRRRRNCAHISSTAESETKDTTAGKLRNEPIKYFVFSRHVGHGIQKNGSYK